MTYTLGFRYVDYIIISIIIIGVSSDLFGKEMLS